MPSLQTALPPELADNVIRVKTLSVPRVPAKSQIHRPSETQYTASCRHGEAAVQEKYACETDPEKIQKLKDDAARGLINHIIYEAEKMTGRKFSGSR